MTTATFELPLPRAGLFLACLLLLAMLLPAGALAQKENDVWYFGRFAGIDFNGASARPITDGALTSFEGTASIADRRTGRILFYTDGVTVWNRNHRPMPNGTELNGDSSTSQAAVIVARPGDDSTFYVFTAGSQDRGWQTAGYQYSVVDLRRDGGLGDVVLKNVPLLSPCTEKLTAVRHCNGRDVWVIGHAWLSDQFYAWRVTDTGVVTTPVISQSGPFIRSRPLGCMQASPDGRWIANAIVGLDVPVVLHQFDASTGEVQDQYFPLLTSESLYGVCFSPDNTKLYVTEAFGRTLYQYDLTLPRYNDILSSRELIYQETALVTLGALQLGPDGRIYMARQGDSMLGVITRPNLRGDACGFIPRGFDLKGRHSELGLPNVAVVTSPLSAGRDTTICPGDSVRLHGIGPAGMRWLPAAGLGCTDCPDPVARPTRTTAYVLTASTSSACPDAGDTVIVTVALPAVDAGRDTTICAGGRIALHGSGDGELRWEPAGDLSCADCSDPVASPARSTTYHLTVTNARGCTAVDSVRVSVFDSTSVHVSPDTTICAGARAMLRAVGTGSFSWWPAASLSCADCADPIATPSVSTTYTVTASGAGGCSATRSVIVTVLPVPSVDAGRDTTICVGDSVTLHAASDVPIRWRFSDRLSCLDCAAPTARPLQTTTFYAEVERNGCVSVDSVTVTVATPPAADAGADATICAGDTTTLQGSGGSIYHWTPSDGLSCDDCAAPRAHPSTTTTYTLAVSGGGSCVATDQVTVTVLPVPAALASGDTTVCPGEPVRLRASGGVRYRWSPADGVECPDCAETVARPVASTVYAVDVWGEGECAGRDSVAVTVKAGTLLRAHLPTDAAIAPGSSGLVPLLLDSVAGTIDTLDLAISYAPELFRFDGLMAAGHLLDGWTIVENRSTRGEIRVTLVAPPGRSLDGRGTLLELRFLAYLGRTLGADLGLAIFTRGGPCSVVDARAGHLRVDSICGLGLRLIEMSTAKYALEGIVPNPVTSSAEIRFSVALDGPTRLVVRDAMGRVVAVPLDEPLEPGAYAVRWDASSHPSGVYHCILTSGAWSAEGSVVLVK